MPTPTQSGPINFGALKLVQPATLIAAAAQAPKQNIDWSALVHTFSSTPFSQNTIADNPTTVNTIAGGIGNVVSRAIQGAQEGYQTPATPKTLQGFSALDAGITSLVSSFKDAQSKIVPGVDNAINTHNSLLTRGVGAGEAALGALNVLFSPVSAIAATASHSIVGGQAIDQVNKIFGAISGGAAHIAAGAVDDSSLSLETKNLIRPFSMDASALVAQLIAGAGAETILPKIGAQVSTITRSIADEYASMTPEQLQAGFAKNPFGQPSKTPETPNPQGPSKESTGKTEDQSPSATPQEPAIKVSSFYNTDRLNISQEAKANIKTEIKAAGTQLEKVVGTPLKNKDVIEAANMTSRVLDSTVTKEQTAAKIAANLKLRQKIAATAENGKIDEDFIKLWMKDKAAGEDIARQLQARRIEANPRDQGAIDTILDSIYKVNKNADEITEAAKGVDFTKPEQVQKFYRQFVKPKLGDWLDILRYNSMLSSPNTHIVNIASNAEATGILAPIEKTITGVIDATKSALTGAPRDYYIGEGLEYGKGFYSSLGKASKNFWDVMKGEKTSENIDVRHIPLTEKGSAGRAVENTLAFPGRLLEAADQFYTTATQAGVQKSLDYRGKKMGLNLKDTGTQASEEATHRLFRSKMGDKDEGHVLNMVEFIPQKIQEARNSTNPLIKWTAKLTFPFVNIGTQLLKQGIEYSPLGITTLAGNTHKIEQLSKFAIGVGVSTAVATMAASDRLTWAEPTNADQKNIFRAAGRQPYSVQIGDTWVSYAKLHPALAWNFALVAAVKDSLANKKINQDIADTILQSAGKWLNFFADQSYMRQVGSIVSAAKGDATGLASFLSNYPTQFVPFRAMLSWIERIIDPVQRQADPNGTQMEKQFQTFLAQIPLLAQNVPTRVGPDGQPIPNQHPLINAFSPSRISDTNPQGEEAYQNIQDITKMNQTSAQLTKQRSQQATSEWAKIQALPTSNEKKAYLTSIAQSDPDLAKRIITEAKKPQGLNATETKLLSASTATRAAYIAKEFTGMNTKEEKRAYLQDLYTKKIATKDVITQLAKLLHQ